MALPSPQWRTGFVVPVEVFDNLIETCGTAALDGEGFALLCSPCARAKRVVGAPGAVCHCAA